MNKISIIFPHQLFRETPLPIKDSRVFILEEYLFFRQYRFHKQKLALHRASMRFYFEWLQSQAIDVHYIPSTDQLSDIRNFIPWIITEHPTEIHLIDPTDNWLEKRIEIGLKQSGTKKVIHPSPMFLNNREEVTTYFAGRKRFFQTDFYIDQRKKWGILLDASQKPKGGQWSFDGDNRKKYPASKQPPSIIYPPQSKFYTEAAVYVNQNFPNNPGILPSTPIYPYDFETAQSWFQQFLEDRLDEFGPYEDALVSQENIMNHSVLTPALNIGLLTPAQVIDQTLDFASRREVPINSLEGFIRQIIGWREFIRAVYLLKGTEERTHNFWGFERKIPASFYDGTTGIPPLDQVIKKIDQTAYAHHIERLMVAGNIMLLCEFHPDEVYRWFMELFIDAYDWVMVPNVYGMSQFADGGLMATKPYISGSNYLMKMSDYPKGDWQKTWDGLFWVFMDKHRSFFLSNPRLGMLVRTFDKMDEKTRELHCNNAAKFLQSIH